MTTGLLTLRDAIQFIQNDLDTRTQFLNEYYPNISKESLQVMRTRRLRPIVLLRLELLDQSLGQSHFKLSGGRIRRSSVSVCSSYPHG